MSSTRFKLFSLEKASDMVRLSCGVTICFVAFSSFLQKLATFWLTLHTMSVLVSCLSIRGNKKYMSHDDFMCDFQDNGVVVFFLVGGG